MFRPSQPLQSLNDSETLIPSFPSDILALNDIIMPCQTQYQCVWFASEVVVASLEPKEWIVVPGTNGTVPLGAHPLGLRNNAANFVWCVELPFCLRLSKHNHRDQELEEVPTNYVVLH